MRKNKQYPAPAQKCKQIVVVANFVHGKQALLLMERRVRKDFVLKSVRKIVNSEIYSKKVSKNQKNCRPKSW